MFRLMRVLRDELGVVVDVVHGKGYVISEWGVLNKKAVIQRNEELVKSWIEKRS
jgi:biotin operon repressor